MTLASTLTCLIRQNGGLRGSVEMFVTIAALRFGTNQRVKHYVQAQISEEDDCSVPELEPHKFKLGQLVMFRPRNRSARAVGGAFTVIGHLPHAKGEPIYQLRQSETDLRQVARESELSAT